MTIRYPNSPPVVTGTLILVLGVLSVIGLPFLGPIAWFLGSKAVKAGDYFDSDPAQRTNAKVGWICGIIGTLFLTIGILTLIVFFTFETRIIKEMHNQSHESATTTITPPSSSAATNSAPSSDPFTDAVVMGDTAKIKTMLATDPSLANKKGPTGETPMFNAAFFGNKDVVALLIDNGADVNAKNDFGETPLDRAEAFHKDDIASLLKSHGAVNGKK